jgi:uncharacterized protein (DUF2141 family)
MTSALFIHILSLLFAFNSPKETGLYIKVLGIKSNQGKVLLGIFKDDGTFPTIGDQYKGYELDIKDKKASIHIKDLPKGTYAIGLCHDLNSNKKMDKNILGFPIEPYGISKNVRGYVSNPTCDEASIYFDGSLHIEITVE